MDAQRERGWTHSASGGEGAAPTPRDAASRTSAAVAPSGREAGQPGKRSGGEAAERPPAAKRARTEDAKFSTFQCQNFINGKEVAPQSGQHVDHIIMAA